MNEVIHRIETESIRGKWRVSEENSSEERSSEQSENSVFGSQMQRIWVVDSQNGVSEGPETRKRIRSECSDFSVRGSFTPQSYNTQNLATQAAHSLTPEAPFSLPQETGDGSQNQVHVLGAKLEWSMVSTEGTQQAELAPQFAHPDFYGGVYCEGGQWQWPQQQEPRRCFDIEPSGIARDGRTTVMVKNIPNKYSAKLLAEEIDGEGHANRYDFLYLPFDFNVELRPLRTTATWVTPSSTSRAWLPCRPFTRSSTDGAGAVFEAKRYESGHADLPTYLRPTAGPHQSGRALPQLEGAQPEGEALPTDHKGLGPRRGPARQAARPLLMIAFFSKRDFASVGGWVKIGLADEDRAGGNWVSGR